MDIEKLKLILPLHLVFEMKGTIERFEINTPLRVAHFVSQVKHESGNFTATQENLNYSANGLRATFSKYFPDIDSALKYERKPEAIANRVYANRMGNLTEASGDGWKFRGRGYLQTTGKNNYGDLSTAMNDPDIIANPDIVATPKYACLSAGYYWHKNKLNLVADKGDAEAIIVEITKKVNGGLIGLDHRRAFFKEIYTRIQ